MANNDGRRAIITDPLAPNPRERSPDRSLQGAAVHAPSTPSAASLTVDRGLTNALQGVEGILAEEFEKKKDGWITEGKVAFQSGQTEQQVLESGNAFTAQGYRGMQARDQVNNWFTEQTVAMDTDGKKVSPAQYAEQMKAQRKATLDGITDPNAKKVASAAFEDMSPRLAASQAIKHNEYNRAENVKSFAAVLASTGRTSATASKLTPENPLAISPVAVGPVMQPSARDRDIGIRTMLGEAANQGADGLAAVAHVFKNRATDPRWPDSIAAVALQPKQFSTWNTGAGGNSIPHTVKPGSPLYERAGQVFDTVMSGKHVDPTGGATHYYSPAGMTKLVNDGSQSNTIPRWLQEEEARSGGRVKIGGHIFVGRASGATARAAAEPQVTALSLATGTEGDLNATQPGAVTGVAQAGGSNEVQQLILGHAMPNEDKAGALADAMRRTLQSGDGTLFRDSGGIAMLHRLGAKPAEIDEVLKARKQFDDKQLTAFSVESEKFRDDVMKRAESGENIDTVLKDIDARHKSGSLNDSYARQLASSAADKIRAVQSEQSSVMTNPDFLNEVGGLFQAIQTGSLSLEDSVAQAKATAEHYGASDKDVKQIIGKMFSDDQSRQNTLRAKAEEAAKQKAAEDVIKGGVDRALAQGYGLGNVSGSVKMANNAGQITTVTAAEYGVAQIKDRASKPYVEAVQNGQMTAGQAKPELERKVALELQKHDLVDKETSAQMAGALTGNIIGKDGTIKPEARQAYDSWLTLKTTPGLTPAYLSKVVPNEQVRNLLEHAYLLDGGTLSKEQSLIKAHEIINDPNRDPKDLLDKTEVWKGKMAVDMKTTLLERTHPGFLDQLFGTKDRSERERILTNNRTAEKYVMEQAELDHRMNPHNHAEVSLEKALTKLQVNSTPVMGNLLITQPGKELHKAMGVSGFGPTAPEEAISTYLRKEGARIWGNSYAERMPSNIIGNSIIGHIRKVDLALNPGNIAAAISPKTFDDPANYKGETPTAPPVHITYNAENQTITVDLYKDDKLRETIGDPRTFSVKAIGNLYVKEQTSPSAWDKTWNGMFKGAAGFISGAKAAYKAEVDTLK